MNIAVAMLGYLAAAAALAGGLAGGVLFLARSGDSQAAAPQRVAPIPPRIAESLERRKPFPAPPITAPAAPTQVGISSTMQESHVALIRTSPKFVLRELPSPPRKRRKQSAPQASTAAFAQGAPPASVVTTARSDNPY